MSLTPQSVRPLGKRLPSRSSEIEQLRRLPDDLVQQLAELGVFRLFIPKVYGGLQQDLASVLAVFEELSYWDSAVGWCAMIGATTAIQSAYLPEEHARSIYGDDPMVISGGVAEPRGAAEFVEGERVEDGLGDGGLVANGRWSWGSGAHHCNWIGGGCRLEVEGQRPRFLFVFFARDQVTLHDNWHVGGLKGTGSGDFEVQGARVPEGRWVERYVDKARVDDPLYRFPHFGLLALGVGAAGLGIARRAIDELKQIAQSKQYVGSRRSLAQRPGVQASVAAAEARFLSARSFVDTAVAEAWEGATGGELGVEQRRRLRLAATHAMRSAVRVVDDMYELAGGSAVFESCPLDRLSRDIRAAASHAMVARRTYELTGRLALGQETDVTQL